MLGNWTSGRSRLSTFFNKKLTQHPKGEKTLMILKMGRTPNTRCYFSSEGQVKDIVCSGTLSNSEWCWIAQGVSCSCLTDDCNEYPPGWRAAASLVEPKGASSNRCSRKCAIFVFMEVLLAVSQVCEGPPSFSEREIYRIFLPHRFGFLVIKM